MDGASVAPAPAALAGGIVSAGVAPRSSVGAGGPPAPGPTSRCTIRLPRTRCACRMLAARKGMLPRPLLSSDALTRRIESGACLRSAVSKTAERMPLLSLTDIRGLAIGARCSRNCCLVTAVGSSGNAPGRAFRMHAKASSKVPRPQLPTTPAAVIPLPAGSSFA